MDYNIECSQCRETLAVSDDIIGRSIHCPLCEKEQIVPAYDPNRVALQQDIGEAIGFFKLTDWDRIYGKKLLELKMVEPIVLRNAIHSAIRATRYGAKTALSEELIRRRIIDEKTDLVLRELINGSPGAEKYAQCANCFAAIPAKSGQCQFCGHAVQDLHIVEMCPNCKRNQAAGAQLCRACGADMETGLKPEPKLSRCPHCGFEITDQRLNCPKCGTGLSGEAMGTQLRKFRSFREALAANTLIILLLVLVIGGVGVWRNWNTVHLWLHYWTLKLPSR